MDDDFLKMEKDLELKSAQCDQEFEALRKKSILVKEDYNKKIETLQKDTEQLVEQINREHEEKLKDVRKNTEEYKTKFREDYESKMYELNERGFQIQNKKDFLAAQLATIRNFGANHGLSTQTRTFTSPRVNRQLPAAASYASPFEPMFDLIGEAEILDVQPAQRRRSQPPNGGERTYTTPKSAKSGRTRNDRPFSDYVDYAKSKPEGFDNREFAAALKVSEATSFKYLAKLREEKVIKNMKTGRNVTYWPAESAPPGATFEKVH